MSRGYANRWEHLTDELQWLDGKLQHLVYQMQAAASTTDNSWKGVYVSEQEVFQLLESSGHETSEAFDDPWLDELSEMETQIAARLKRRKNSRALLPLPYLTQVFGLSRLESKCLLIGLAVELDRKYERIFAYLQDDLNSKLPTVNLALRLLCSSTQERWEARNLFAPQGKLFRYFFQAQEDGPLLSRPLRLEERIVRWILDGEGLDDRLQHGAELMQPGTSVQPLLWEQNVQEQLAGFLAKDKQQTACWLWGPSGSGKKLQVRHLCQTLGHKLLIVDLRKVLLEDVPMQDMLRRVEREGKLHQAALAFANLQVLMQEGADNAKRMSQLLEAVSGYDGLVFLLSEQEWKSKDRHHAWLEVRLQIPPDSVRKELWQTLSREEQVEWPVDWGMMASTFRFTVGQMRRSLQSAAVKARWASQITPELLYAACYEQVQHRLEQKATRLQPKATLEHLVLPEQQVERLKHAIAQMKHRPLVYGEWGFDRKLSYGKGLSMLFAGPPGTGKTMAAEVIAKELQLQIYKIDLSQVISKYIGETEKNLHEIFTEAQASSSILFFDEADALFGKRSEVKDSHDKHANVETAYLLQKMEEYDGVSILATNFLQNLDEAFMRRLNVIIQFPFPDSRQREQLWRSMFPPETPLADLDYPWLAETFELAGGNIKNIAMSAAFLAAEHGQINMRHVVTAARNEMQKAGKVVPRLDYDFGEGEAGQGR